MNVCSACGLNFGSVGAFDRHRVGDFPQTGPAEYADRLRAGLVSWDEEWKRSFGRRCLDTNEMLIKGFAQNNRGDWTIAKDLERARARKPKRGQAVP